MLNNYRFTFLTPSIKKRIYYNYAYSQANINLFRQNISEYMKKITPI